MFTDRSDAGRQLVAELRRRNLDPDVVVGIARGGVPVARVVANSFDATLDATVAERVRAPDNPALVVGAVAPDGSSWVNSPLLRYLDLDWESVEAEMRAAEEAAVERAVGYGADWGPLDVTDKDVVVVDDGIATGAAVRVAIQRLAAESPATLVAAAPVAPPDVLERVEEWADDAIAPLQPAAFQSTADYYDSFETITDEELATVATTSG